MTDGAAEIHDNEPYDNPRKYEIIADEYRGKPRGETIILDANHPMVIRGLKDRAIRLLDEPAYTDDGN